ncbi:MAG: hypothetical protein R2843_13250 [Thermomicrobiales bacterium]
MYGEALGRYYHDTFGMRVFNLRIGSMRADDDPRSPAVASSSGWLQLEPAEAYARLRATWLSQHDCAELMACCLEASDVDWAIVYGISDNPRQFWISATRANYSAIPRAIRLRPATRTVG